MRRLVWPLPSRPVPMDGHVLLRVADTGIGIQPAFLPHLFSEFRQESTGLGRSYEGSGLGLAITDQIVRLMGGTIDVESTPGEGSVFAVTLPRDARILEASGLGDQDFVADPSLTPDP